MRLKTHHSAFYAQVGQIERAIYILVAFCKHTGISSKHKISATLGIPAPPSGVAGKRHYRKAQDTHLALFTKFVKM